ncbi:MAG: hypothetical protein MR935_01820 [Agathobaculum sp.]|uniref:hypothetical protein n=1 Tax=Agathobaculum sp. TaxID=2048138 RepID=UPI0025BFDFE5|nr:hypothetical protein [Agathobaculum sp.]MCI7124931.1 hypothetical protein [Agathobaculum sp.]
MAVVATYHYPHGTVQICDDAYRGVTQAELKRREDRMWQTAYEIAINAEKRRRKSKGEKAD